eukprot:CAMPEP_0173078886 /NCGR_PEP_ID=MMETSP1102-20130122/14591_1 /TAXON_ID=49646 /ORGANISM="Geminigera sp., Strain Caron Lab Isolate" /LENGTH=116 /DNA_ID=CAMNT_0013950655 /DNA_START=559 /DNA_END=906 /DNA_ORIENTATION=-
MHARRMSADCCRSPCPSPASADARLQAEKVRPTQLRWMKWQKAVWRTVATEGPHTSARSFTLAAAFSSKNELAGGPQPTPLLAALCVDPLLRLENINRYAQATAYLRLENINRYAQ